jgi:plastocyanin
MSHRLPTLRNAAAGLLLASGLAIACFSDHGPTGAAPDVSAACQLPATTDVEGSTVVTIRGYAFHPAIVHIRRGSRVTWVNCESVAGLAHTSSSDSPQWSSGLITPGSVFTQTFETAGTFGYHCQPHPFMTATVVVE